MPRFIWTPYAHPLNSLCTPRRTRWAGALLSSVLGQGTAHRQDIRADPQGCSRSCDRTMHRLRWLGYPLPPGASSASGGSERRNPYRGGRGAMGGAQPRSCSITLLSCETRNGSLGELQRFRRDIRGSYQVKRLERGWSDWIICCFRLFFYRGL